MSEPRPKGKGGPGFVVVKSRYLRRRRILKGARDAERGLPDTERRGVPNDVPAPRRSRRS